MQTNREGDKTVPSGTGNRCAMLKNGYLELLTATPSPNGDTVLSAQLRERIADHPGLHLLAFATADAAAEHHRLGAVGFTTLPLVDMRRPVKVPGGGDDFARFTIARIAHGTMPEGRAQFLTHHTEELVWLPDMLDHPNGATALAALWIAAADPAEPAARYARFANDAARQDGGVTTIALDRGALHIATPAHLAEALGIAPQGTLPCWQCGGDRGGQPRASRGLPCPVRDRPSPRRGQRHRRGASARPRRCADLPRGLTPGEPAAATLLPWLCFLYGRADSRPLESLCEMDFIYGRCETMWVVPQ